MARGGRLRGPRRAAPGPRPERAPDGRAIARHGPILTVEISEQETVECEVRGRGKKVVVGDRVFIEEGSVTGYAPRTTELVRADAMGRRPQVVAANVDRLYVVVAVEPPLREGLIDRYLVAAHMTGLASAIVFNKTDLFLDEEDEADHRERLSPYPALGCPVHYVSAETDEGVEALRAATVGHTGIFVGHSGVGKTSLLNALDPGLGERVGELSDASGRGQHTTARSALYRIPGGGEIIDSPGIRAFALWGLEPDALRHHFVEFVERADACRFANCVHVHEPGCAVIAAVEAEEIHPARYASYLRLRASLESDPLK